MATFGPKVWEGYGIKIHVTAEPSAAPSTPKMTDWIHDAMVVKPRGEHLRQLRLIDGEEVVHTTIFTGERFWKPRALAEMFRRKASERVEETQGVHAFRLVAFYGTKLARAPRRFEWEQGHRKVRLRIEGEKGSTFRVYESLAYARALDVSFVHDRTLEPKTKRARGPR